MGRDAVPGVVRAAAAVTAGGVVVLAGGFADGDARGRQLQLECVETARTAGMALLGPNCQGLVNTARPNALYSAPLNTRPRPGRAAFISQSGGLVNAMLNNSVGVGFSHVVSVGNEADVDTATLIDYFVDDDSTDTILAFLETVRAPDRFFAACDRARGVGKPVVVVKSGTSVRGREAATAHSGALATPERLIDALFRRHGVLRAKSLDALLQTARVFAGAPQPKRPRLGFVTLSGGQNGLLLDILAEMKLEAPPFSAATEAFLGSRLPKYQDPSNPVDLWGIEQFDTSYRDCVRQIASDPEVDGVVTLAEATASYPSDDPELARMIGEVAADAQRTSGKPVILLTTLAGNLDVVLADSLATAGVTLLCGMQDGLAALEAAAMYADHQSAPIDAPRCAAAMPRRRLPQRPLAGREALDALSLLGIPTIESRLAGTAVDAVRAATSLSYPVVLKTADPTVRHKSEVRGVITGLADAAAVERAFSELEQARLTRSGVLVQPQLQGEAEVFLGLRTEQELGTFILVGLGGVWTELFDDVAVRPLPLRCDDLDGMIAELHAQAIFAGVRGSVASVDVLRPVVERLADFGTSEGRWFASVDINPVILSRTDATAVDGLFIPVD